MAFPPPSKKNKSIDENLAPVVAARAPLPFGIWRRVTSLLPIEICDEPLNIQFIHGISPKEADELGVDITKGHSLLAHFAMELLTDEWFDKRNPWEKDPVLGATEQFCLVHGVYHAWLSEDGAAMEWAMDMCLDVEKMYWWLCAARREEGGLHRVVEDLTSQDHLPGIKLMASLVRLSTRAIRTDQRQWVGQVMGRLGEMVALGQHAFLSGASRLLGKKPQALKALVPKDKVSGLETAGGAVLSVLVGHVSIVFSVAYSPDGLRVASGSGDETVRIWDAQSGHMLSMWEGHTSRVNSVAYSPDGRYVASGSRDQTVRIWDTQTDQVLQVLEGHTHWVNSVAFSPDGLKVASGSHDKTVRVWDAQTGKMLRILKGHTDRVWSVAYSPDGLKVASGSYDGTARIWDANWGNMLKVLEGHTRDIMSVAYSPDGLRLASGSYDDTVRVWDTLAGHMLRMWEGHTEDVTSVAYSPDGLQVASGSNDKTVRVCDSQTGIIEGVLEGHTDWVRSVSYSPDGRYVASASDDKTVRIWDTSALGAVRRKKMKEIQGDAVSSKDYISENFSITSRNENTVSFTFDNHVYEIRASLDVMFSSSEGVSLKIV